MQKQSVLRLLAAAICGVWMINFAVSSDLILTPLRTNETLQLTLTGGASSNAYVINYSPALTPAGGNFYPICAGARHQSLHRWVERNFRLRSRGAGRATLYDFDATGRLTRMVNSTC